MRVQRLAITVFAVLTLTSVATLAAQIQNAATLNSAGEGRRLFLKLNCYGCHGIRAGGGMGPNLRTGEVETGDVSSVLSEGSEHGMPSFQRYLTRTDVTNIENYLRSLGTPAEPVFTHWWEPVPSH